MNLGGQSHSHKGSDEKLLVPAEMPASYALLQAPLHKAEHLGLKLPESPFAVSVAMPTWQDVIDYEKGVERVTGALQSGYPRFVVKGFTERLFENLSQIHCRTGERLIGFPSAESAERCLLHVRQEFSSAGRIESTEYAPIAVCVIPEQCYKRARTYWQHSGEIISARWAEACLNDKEVSFAPSISKERVRARLAGLSNASYEDVHLFPTGMAGIAAVQRAVQLAAPGRETAQVGFPYVDTLKIQQKFGAGCLFFPATGSPSVIERDINELNHAAEAGKISAIYTEFPTNPLLTVPPLQRLWEISVRHRIPLIVDETLGSFVNTRVLPYATAVITSLTKYFSGEGDVCGGSVIWNRAHPAYSTLAPYWDGSGENQLFEGDAAALERNSRDFVQRMRRINESTDVLVDYLAHHPKVEAVCYPNQLEDQRVHFDLFRRENGGYGGLFSVRLRGGEEAAATFYDALEISKGPSLGTNFSIACPYTLLAHFLELPQVLQYGVTADLIRVSIGLEAPTDLIRRFERALMAVR